MNLVERIKQAFNSVFNDFGSSWNSSSSLMGFAREPFSGAWQRNIQCESRTNIMAFSAVYACVTLISNDISKLCVDLVEVQEDGTYQYAGSNAPHYAVLRKPNDYQTRQQFIAYWVIQKLLYGNEYVLKGRDNRGIVNALYALDARRVLPLITDQGDVYYQLNRDLLAKQPDAVVVPASEIIHDRMVTLWHPLIGITPIYACGATATLGIRIQNNSEIFFDNMSRPSGTLTSPDVISDETAAMYKKRFEENYSGGKLGRLLVAGSGLKYEAMSMPAADAQLIEQLRWTIEDVCRAFLVPDYKIISPASGRAPAANLAALNQDYYNQTLQVHIESIEALLAEGLSLPSKYDVKMDLDGLLRMDPLSRAEAFKSSIGAGFLAPNEARARENYAPVVGGDSPYLQQQNYSLAALAKRDASEDPFNTAKPVPVPAPAVLPAPQPTKSMEDAKQLADELIARFVEVTRG